MKHYFLGIVVGLILIAALLLWIRYYIPVPH